MFPDWENFIKVAKSEGANMHRLINKISVLILDAWGKEAHTEIMAYIDKTFTLPHIV